MLTGEPVGATVIECLDRAGRALMSAASFVELGIVLEARFGPVGGAVAERFTREGGIEIVPLETEQARLAIEAWRRFGKGHHRAGLNYGDCFTYALAASAQLPVLCVGDDFAHSDIEVVSP